MTTFDDNIKFLLKGIQEKKKTMLSTSLLVVPIPPSRANSSLCDNSLKQLLSGQAQEALQFSARSKSPIPDDDSFSRYLIILKSLGNSNFSNEWWNPFDQSKSMKSESVFCEAGMTIWNFISFLQTQIMSYNTSSSDEKPKIKNGILDINALIQNLKYVMREMSVSGHGLPFFTNGLISFIESYHKYLSAAMLLSAAQNESALNENDSQKRLQFCRAALMTLNTLSECEVNLRYLDDSQRAFFAPIVDMLKRYYNGLVYFEAGKDRELNSDHGIGICFYREGIRLTNGYDRVSCPHPHIYTQVKMISNALEAADTRATNDNKRLYSQSIPHDIPPFQFAPYKLPEQLSEPSKRLLIFEQFIYPSSVLPQQQQQLQNLYSSPPGSGSGQSPPVFSPPFISPQLGTPGPPIFTPPGSTGSSSGATPLQPQTQSFSPQPPFSPPITGSSPPPFGFQATVNQFGSNPDLPYIPSMIPPVPSPPGSTNSPYIQQPPIQQQPIQFQLQQLQQAGYLTQFPLLAMVLQLRVDLGVRAREIRPKLQPSVQAKFDQQMQIFMQAASCDSQIVSAIARLQQSGPNPAAGLTKQSVDSLIGQAACFYHEFDDFLDSLQ
ncbi:hypothetical protein TRFO_36446 [Tritrichomonas foetus]|uniref:BRO1 domain-containing protein n=1 Tax=Tritrichomonas foetus TaxID=1144522 RepID=A0A1J4JGC6_9EUKA|nr:hypothetical protein TRFO_36446 [Tritrichomonas foetus]|eukprot:OHS97351.1 hypothetical protein TRFO_36446 [Tritrichomonas foetus]